MLDDDARDQQVAKPLVIGGNDEPRRVLGAATRECFFVAGDVFVPEAALLVVGLADLPVLAGVVEPLFETLQLLFFGDVQEELENLRAVRGQVALEIVDLIVAARPDGFRDEVVHADDENILVMRAVEDDHFAAGRRGFVRAP